MLLCYNKLVMKEKFPRICPKCNSKNTKKNGHSKGVQRYKCKNPECGYVFLETRKRVAFSMKKKALLYMLKLLMSNINNFENSIDEIITKAELDSFDFSKFRFIKRSIKENTAIDCYNPRLLICEDSDIVTIYDFEPKPQDERKIRRFTILDDETKCLTKQYNFFDNQ